MANRKNTFLLKRSNVPGKIPQPGDIQLGELALNTADVKLYTSGTTQNGIIEIGWDRISRTGDTVTGDFNFTGDISISGASQPGGYALSVTGDTNLVGDVYVLGDLNYSGSVFITGSTIIEDGLTANTIYTDYIDFNVTPPVVQPSIGRLSWNETDKTLEIGTGDGDTVLQIGQETVYPPVVNGDSIDLVNGTLVMIDPNDIAQGNRIKVVRMVSDGTYPAQYMVGVLTEDIPKNQEGFATWFGYVRNLNRNTLENNNIKFTGETWSEGDVLYPSPTLIGGLTNIAPSAPNINSTVAVITAVNGVNITLLVRPTISFTLTELTNVRTTGLTDGDIIVYNSDDSVWESTKTLRGNYTINGDLSVTGTTGLNTLSANTIGLSGNCVDDIYVSNIHSCSPLNINPLDEGNVYFGSTSGVTVDLTNVRLGIGTDSPEYRFVTTGSTGYFYYDGSEVRNAYRQSELAILGPSSGITNVSVKQFPTPGKTIELGMFVVGEDTPNTALWRGIGKSGDTSLYSSSGTQDLNIINGTGSGTTDNINFFAGFIGNITNQTPDLHIHGSGSTKGYIGINTNSPSEKLHVSGNALITGITFTGNLIVTGGTGVNWISGSTSTDMLRITQTGSGNAFVVEDSQNPDTTSFGINGSGLVGVGITPSTWSSVTNPTYVGMQSTGNRFYVSGNIIAGGDKLGVGYYNTTNPFNISNIISGTTTISNFGSLLESYENGHFVIGLRDNGVSDGFYILSHNGSYTGTSNYEKLIATFKGGGNIGFGGIKEPSETLEVSGKTKTTNFQMTSGATAGYVLKALDSNGNSYWDSSTVSVSNIGSGVGLYSGTSGTTLLFKTLTSSGNTISISSDSTTINLEKNNQVSVVSVNSSYSATTTDEVIGVNTSSNPVTIYLPDSSSSGTIKYDIKDIGLNSLTNNITVLASGTDTIITSSSVSSIVLSNNGVSITLINDGSGQWWQI